MGRRLDNNDGKMTHWPGCMKSASPAWDPATQTDKSQFVVAWCAIRRLMITENGFLGLVPKEAVIGDEVCILFGGDVPYILRPTAEDKEFQSVGDWYVHDIMDGEAITMRRGEQPVPRKFLAELLNSDAKEEVTQKLIEQTFRLAELTPDDVGIPWDFLYLR